MPDFSKKTVNFAGYLITWLSSAYGTKYGHVYLGFFVALVFVSIHLYWCESIKHELKIIAFVTLLGCGIDSTLYHFHYLKFLGDNPWYPLTPPWMWGAWLAFSTMLNSSLAILQKYHFTAANIGAIDLPLSYLIAAKIGVIIFIQLWKSMFILSMSWLILLPLSAWLARPRKIRT